MPPPPRKTPPPLIGDETGDLARTMPLAGPVDPTFPFLRPPTRPGDLGTLGPYRVLSLLGQGGMGVVFGAEEPALKRQVALKVMLPKVAGNPQARARFLREARAAAAVEHDHVIPIFQVGEDGDVPFLAMPLLKGMSLADALAAGKPPVTEAVRIAREIADGLAAAHEQGLIHRDIKPANVWLEGSKRRVKILDFGLARAVADADPDAAAESSFDAVTADLTRTGALVGTPSYMAPEQAEGKPVDHRADLWSLGVVLYQMLAGRRPFVGTVSEVLAAISSTEPPPLTDVPPEVAALVRRLMAKNPADRPASAVAVEAELKQTETNMSAVTVIRLDPADPWAEIDATTVDDQTLSHAAERSLRSEAKRGSGGIWWLAGLAVLVAVAVGAFALLKPERKPVVDTTQPPTSKPQPPLPPRKPKEKPVVPLPEGFVDERALAEKLHLVMDLHVCLAGETVPQSVKSNEPLPAGSFVVTKLYLPRTKPPLDPSTAAIVWPTVSELHHLGSVLDPDGRLVTTDDDVCRLLALPNVARTLVQLEAPMTLGPAVVAALGQCPKLTGLNLDPRRLDDDGLVRLATLPRIANLWFQPWDKPALRNWAVTAGGLTAVARLPLQSLHNCPVRTPAEARALAGIPTLRKLGAELFEPAADATAAVFAESPVSHIELAGPLTDAGLAAFAGRKELKHLRVTSPTVSEAAIRKLAATLPGCSVFLNDKSIQVVPDDSRAAALLHPFTILTVEFPDGTKILQLRPEDPLPAAPFVVRFVVFQGKPPLDPATHAVARQALLELIQLDYLLDADGKFLQSEDDLARLVAVPRFTRSLITMDLALPISPAVAESLRQCSALAGLNLHPQRLDDDGLVRLAALPHLRTLWLKPDTSGRNWKVTARGLTALSQRPFIQLKGVPLRSAAEARIVAGIPSLALLGVRLTEPTTDANAIAAALVGTTASKLIINGPLTDAGLDVFQGKAGLKVLDIESKYVSDSALRKLAATLPTCEVRRAGKPLPAADKR